MTRGRLPAAAVAACLVLSGCAQDAGGPRLPAPADAKPGGTLVVGIGPPGSVDPANAFEPNGTLIAGTMCDPLIGVDPETGELVPALAERWQVVENGHRILITLRRDLQFSDGSPLTSEDVVDSLSRAASAAYAGDAAVLLEPIAGYAAIRGQDPEADEEARESLDGVQALTEQTVQISLVTASADFLTVLTHPVASPVSSEALGADPEGFEQQPVCAGPYRLAKPFDEGASTVRLTRVPDYQGTNDSYTGGGRGYADEIVFRVLPELAEGDSPDDDGKPVPDPQVAAPPSKLDGVDVLAVAGPLRNVVAERPDLTVTSVAGPGIEYIGLPATTTSAADSSAPEAGTAAEVPTPAPGEPAAVGGALQESRDPSAEALHTALSLALDRTRIARRVYGAGRAPASGFVPPALGDAPDSCAAAMPPTGDVAGARRLLRNAGVALRGQELRFAFNDDFANAAVVREVARQWAAAFDVTVTLEPQTFDEYLALAAGTEGFSGPFRFSWSVPYPSLDQYLYPLFTTSGIGQTNFSGYSDPVFDEVISEQARQATDPEDRELLYAQLQERLCAVLPLIPLLVEQRTWAYRADRVTSTRDVLAAGIRAEPLLRELYLSR